MHQKIPIESIDLNVEMCHLTFAQKVKEKADWKCELCHTTEPIKVTAHHKIPKSKGGKSTLNNGICLCEKCHRKQHAAPIKRATPQIYIDEKIHLEICSLVTNKKLFKTINEAYVFFVIEGLKKFKNIS
jgi:predicted restriction endonuclease